MGSASTGSGSVRKYARHSAARWRALINEFEASGVSQQAFCTRHSLAKSTFELWRRKLRGARSTEVAGVRPEALFVELTAPVVDKTEVLPAVSGQTPPLYLSVGEYGFHRIVGEACLPLAWRELDCPTRRMHADALQHINQVGVRVHAL